MNTFEEFQKSCYRFPKRNWVFTLIELLLVISIISILTSILLPALKKARGKAREAVCASNMKQQGMAMFSYAGDFNSFYPYAYNQNSSGSITGPTWQITLCPYLDIDVPSNNMIKTRIFSCPSDTRPVADNEKARAASNSYGMNASTVIGVQDGIFIKDSTKISKPRGDIVVTGFFGPVRMEWVNTPEKTMAIVDGANSSSNCKFECDAAYSPSCVITFYYVNYEQTKQYHTGRNNYLCCDGHVTSLTPEASAGTGDYSTPRGIWTKRKND